MSPKKSLSLLGHLPRMHISPSPPSDSAFCHNQSLKLWTSLLLSSELRQWSSSGRKAKIFHRVYCPQSEPDFQQHAARQLGAGRNKKAISSFGEAIRCRSFGKHISSLPPTAMHRHLRIPPHVSLFIQQCNEACILIRAPRCYHNGN